MNATANTSATFSVASIIAIVAALFSFPAGAFWGLVLAIIAVVFGLIGIVVALLPAKRGGFVSAFSILAGAVGIVVAFVKILMWIF